MLNKRYSPKEQNDSASSILWGPLTRFSKTPVEDSLVFSTLDSLKEYVSNSDSNLYDGQIVAVNETKKIYLLRDGNDDPAKRIIEFATVDELKALNEKLTELTTLTNEHDEAVRFLKDKAKDFDAYISVNDKDIADIKTKVETLKDDVEKKQAEVQTLVNGLKSHVDNLDQKWDSQIININKDITKNSADISTIKENLQKLETNLNTELGKKVDKDELRTINGESIFGSGDIKIKTEVTAEEIKKLIDSGDLDLNSEFATDAEVAEIRKELEKSIAEKQDKFDLTEYAKTLEVNTELGKKVDKDELSEVAVSNKIPKYDSEGRLRTVGLKDPHDVTLDETLVPNLKDLKEYVKYSIDNVEHPLNKDQFKTINGKSIFKADDGETNIEITGGEGTNIEANVVNDNGEVITDGLGLQNIKIDNKIYAIPNKANITQEIINDTETIKKISEKAQSYTPTNEIAGTTSITVGGLEAGSDLGGKTLSDIVQAILIGGNKTLHNKNIYYGLSDFDPDVDDISAFPNSSITTGKTSPVYSTTGLEELSPKGQSIFIAVPVLVPATVGNTEYTVDNIQNASGMSVIGMFYTDSRTIDGVGYKLFISDKRSVSGTYTIQISKKGG